MVLVSEVLDPETRALLKTLDTADMVMSNDIVSALLAQVRGNAQAGCGRARRL